MHQQLSLNPHFYAEYCNSGKLRDMFISENYKKYILNNKINIILNLLDFLDYVS